MKISLLLLHLPGSCEGEHHRAPNRRGGGKGGLFWDDLVNFEITGFRPYCSKNIPDIFIVGTCSYT